MFTNLKNYATLRSEDKMATITEATIAQECLLKDPSNTTREKVVDYLKSKIRLFISDESIDQITSICAGESYQITYFEVLVNDKIKVIPQFYGHDQNILDFLLVSMKKYDDVTFYDSLEEATEALKHIKETSLFNLTSHEKDIKEYQKSVDILLDEEDSRVKLLKALINERKAEIEYNNQSRIVKTVVTQTGANTLIERSFV